MEIILDDLSDVNLETAWQVGFENSAISFSNNTEHCIENCRKAFERFLESEDVGFVYGSTAAPGARAKTPLSAESKEELAKNQNLWAPNSFGCGNNCIPEHGVRLILLARIASYIKGHGRVRLETAKWVANLLNSPMPSIPLDAATGPGEVMPLSWLYPKLSDIELADGEIMSLFNGSPCASGLVTDAALTAKRRFRLCQQIFALSIEAVAAPLEAYDPALIKISTDPDYCNVLKQLNKDLSNVPKHNRLPHQAPVSWRVIPTLLATLHRAVSNSQITAEQSLQSISHNPVYLPPDSEYPDGRTLSTGGYHNHQASRAIDLLNMANADICVLAAKQTSRLLDGAAFDLPKLLIPEDSGVIGTEFLAWSQTSHAERAKQAASPSLLSMGLEDPAGGQSDIASPIFLAYERYLQVSDSVDAALATLSIAVVQAYRLSGRKPPEQLKQTYQSIDADVIPIELDQISKLGTSLRRVKKRFFDAIINQGSLAKSL